MGTTLAIFIWLGTIPVVIERLPICTGGVSILFLIPLTIFGSNPSHPAALFFKLFKIMFTSFSSTGKNNNMDSFTLSLSYSTGELLLLGIAFNQCGSYVRKTIIESRSNCSRVIYNRVIIFENTTFFLILFLLITIFNILQEEDKLDLCSSNNWW